MLRIEYNLQVSTATYLQARALDPLHEIAIESAALAPSESQHLLALLGQSEDEAGAPVALILAALAAVRACLLEAATPEAGRLWESLRAAGHELRGAFVEGLRNASTDDLERSIAQVRELPSGADGPFAVLRDVLDDPGLVIAVAGDFKRGKSTLINALVGRRVLPTRVAPATAVPCVLRAGADIRARVFLRDYGEPISASIDDIERYACIVLPGGEEDELAFRADVDHVEIDLASLLPPNVTVIDLPGLNEEHGRAETAREILDRADVIIMVLAATQLLAEDELQLIDTLWSQGHRSLIFAVNYIDGLEDHEISTVRQRCCTLLAPYGGVLEENIFLVSARQALLAQVDGRPVPPETGIPDLQSRLQQGLIARGRRTWLVSRLRQVLDRLDVVEEDAGLAALRRQEALRQTQAELESIAERLSKAERIYADGDIATAHNIAMRRQRVADHDALFDGRWAALEAAIRERFKRESFAWIMQKAREWLRDEMIKAIREVNPQVSPRPEGYLRISVGPGLWAGRDALLAFYVREATREWERFTSTAREARRRELEEALAEAEREAKRLADSREASWAPLAARQATLGLEQEAGEAATRTDMQRAVAAAEALRLGLEAIAG